MTDDDLQFAIAELGRPPFRPTSDITARRRAALLAEVLGAIRQRGGKYVWNGVEYYEKPPGLLARTVHFG
jgi:hypothetical protein